MRGSVVSGLTAGDVYRLDIFEGDQYEKQAVSVEILDSGIGVYDAAPEGDAEGGVAVTSGEGHAAGQGDGNKEIVTAQTYVWSAPESYLEAKEWDFEDFKTHKMRAWMGDPADGASSEHGDSQGDREVQVDSGFADVDRAVKEMEAEKARGDPTGGRGVNGAIGRQLAEVQRGG